MHTLRVYLSAARPEDFKYNTVWAVMSYAAYRYAWFIERLATYLHLRCCCEMLQQDVFCWNSSCVVLLGKQAAKKERERERERVSLRELWFISQRWIAKMQRDSNREAVVKYSCSFHLQARATFIEFAIRRDFHLLLVVTLMIIII